MSISPEGPEADKTTITIGGPIDRVRVRLIFAEDSLDPDRVTALLGCQPEVAARKGELIPGRTYHALTNIWVLRNDWSTTRIEEQIVALLQRATDDPQAWEQLEPYNGRISCSLQLKDWNRGLELSPALLKQLAERHLGLGFDIYCDCDEET